MESNRSNFAVAMSMGVDTDGAIYPVEGYYGIPAEQWLLSEKIIFLSPCLLGKIYIGLNPKCVDVIIVITTDVHSQKITLTRRMLPIILG